MTRRSSSGTRSSSAPLPIRLLTYSCSKLLQRECTKNIKKARSCPRSPDSASGAEPWTQSRQVHLKCGERTLCNATSFVTITQPLWARAWASVPSEQVTLPALFALLGTVPEFTLLGISARGGEIRRTYRVASDGVECEVLEVFPDRAMFSAGADWDVDGLGPVVEDTLANQRQTKLALDVVAPLARLSLAQPTPALMNSPQVKSASVRAA